MCTLLESNRWLKNHCCQWSIWQCGAIGFGWFWDGLLGQLGLKLIFFVSFLINFGLKNSNQIKFSSGRANDFYQTWLFSFEL